MLHEIDWAGPGRLATMAHPPGGGQLAASMGVLADSGAQVLVSALCEPEVQELALTGQAVAADAAGLAFVRFPIVDCTAPPPEATPAVRALADRLADEMRAGRFVATHCWAGIGRSSMLAGATLVQLGVTPAGAWELIRAARGLPVPDNPSQEQWLYTFARGG